MMVQVMSRDSTLSAISVPTSAGDILGGGSYIGATDSPASGSLPFNHHRVNMTTKAKGGRKTMGLLRRNHATRVTADGWRRMPLGIKTSRVNPSRRERGLEVSKGA